MRIAISSFAALFVTLALFYVMQSMIKGSGQPIEKPLDYGVVDFVRLQQGPADSKTESARRMPARRPATSPRIQPALPSHLPAAPPLATSQPELTTEPLPSLLLGKPFLEAKAPSAPLANVATEPHASVHSSVSASSKTAGADALNLPTGAAPELQGGSGNVEAEAMPIFTVEPRYPRKAARRKIEGWVKLEFTITESGAVSDPVVVDSKPRRTFDRSAIESIRKWRFKPKVVDGRPIQRKASQVIEFRLASG